MLARAIADFEVGMQMPSWHPAIALAELRIRQGRLADAEMLLLGKDGHLQALLPAAHLHLARGDYDLARATAVRGLRAIGDDRLRAAELLAVLVDTELGVGDVKAAAAACDDRVARAAGLDVPGLQARTAAIRARVVAAGGDVAAAIGTMETALDKLPATGVPLRRANLLLDLVRLHEQAGNRAAARVEVGPRLGPRTTRTPPPRPPGPPKRILSPKPLRPAKPAPAARARRPSRAKLPVVGAATPMRSRRATSAAGRTTSSPASAAAARPGLEDLEDLALEEQVPRVPGMRRAGRRPFLAMLTTVLGETPRSSATSGAGQDGVLRLELAELTRLRGHVIMVVCGILAALLVARVMRTNQDTVSVAVANRYIAPGAVVTRDVVSWVSLPAHSALTPPLAGAAEINAPRPPVAATRIRQGDPIRRSDLGAALASNQRAMSIPVPADHAAGGQLAEGDRVDVIAPAASGSA